VPILRSGAGARRSQSSITPLAVLVDPAEHPSSVYRSIHIDQRSRRAQLRTLLEALARSVFVEVPNVVGQHREA
jgi:hypothetical protein